MTETARLCPAPYTMGGAYESLAAVKPACDPANLLRVNQNIAIAGRPTASSPPGDHVTGRLVVGR